MDYKEIIFENNGTEKSIKIKNKLILHGKNQTGKTTFIYLINAIFGFQKNYISKALSKKGIENLNSTILVSGDGINYKIKRRFSDQEGKQKRKLLRHNYSSKLEVYNANSGIYNDYDTFIDFVDQVELDKIPVIPNLRDVYSSRDDRIQEQYKKINITDLGRLFIHSQNPDLVLGAHIYSTSLTMFFTYLKLVTDDYDDSINLLLEKAANYDKDILVKNIKEFNASLINTLPKEKTRLIKSLSINKNLDSKELKLAKESIVNKQIKLNDLKKQVNLIEQQNSELRKRIDDLKINTDFKDYLVSLLIDGASSSSYDEININFDKIKELKKDIKELQSVINRDKKLFHEEHIKKIDEKTFTEKDKMEIMERVETIKFINEIPESNFNLRKEVKNIEIDFFEKFVNKSIERELDYLYERLKKRMSDENKIIKPQDIERFEELRETNYNIFAQVWESPEDKIYTRPQGAMVDIYDLFNIYLKCKILQENNKKIPFVIIDTPIRNENEGFYYFLVEIILEEIFNLNSIDFTVLATANEKLSSTILERNKNIEPINTGDEEKSFIIFPQ